MGLLKVPIFLVCMMMASSIHAIHTIHSQTRAAAIVEAHNVTARAAAIVEAHNVTARAAAIVEAHNVTARAAAIVEAHNVAARAAAIVEAHNVARAAAFVAAHNVARAAVGVAPLVWDAKLAAYAQHYANIRAQDCAMVHSSTKYGENLAGGSWEISAKEAVEMWVDEKILYDDANSNCVVGGECLHYTQVVWKNTTRVGCGTTRCLNGWTFVTCNYSPAGNIIGESPF